MSARRIIEEWRDYPAHGPFRRAERRLWYVVLEGEREVTRDLKRAVAELYLRPTP